MPPKVRTTATPPPSNFRSSTAELAAAINIVLQLSVIYNRLAMARNSQSVE